MLEQYTAAKLRLKRQNCHGYAAALFRLPLRGALALEQGAGRTVGRS